MNDLNKFIANIYVVLLNLRDTLHFCMDIEQPVNVFKARKEGIASGYMENSALKKFLDDNKEKGAEIEKHLRDFVEEIYGDDSTVLKIAEDKVRVDHTQHIKIYENVVGLNETIRDILRNYMGFAMKQNMFDESMDKLLKTDEALYRAVIYKFVLADLEKCFVEFNKVMQESGGKPSPQSNFIIQNEFSKYASELRFVREHNHLTDNRTWDFMDHTLQTLEMLEGRRDRRDPNKNFNEYIFDCKKEIDEYIKDAELAWKNAYEPILNEMVALVKAQKEKENEEIKA